MTPWLDDGDVALYHGDAAAVLRSLPAGSVQTCVTSPPYWGLRDYGTGQWDGGDPECDHQRQSEASRMTSTLGNRPRSESDMAVARNQGGSAAYGATCGRCGARRVDAQLGLEARRTSTSTRLVAVFREVRRVLRDDGTLWLNLGDSYATGAGRNDTDDRNLARRAAAFGTGTGAGTGPRSFSPMAHPTKQKDLVGIPWRVAFALQADGWVLRSDVVWSKPNPMPESVTDRPTKAHEMVFLFAKAKWIGPEPGRYAGISDEDARWLALLFDTEGNIVIKRAERDGRVQYGAQIAFANTSRRLLDVAQGIVGAGSIHERSGTNAPMFYWQMTGQQARDLLHRIYPYLIVKQRQARVGIYMQDVVAEPKRRPGGYRTEEHTAFLERCWQTVKALNQFGDPDLAWVSEPKFGGWRACESYYWDADAIREPHAYDWTNEARIMRRQSAERRMREDVSPDSFTRSGGKDSRVANDPNPAGRNARSVWQIATQPTPEAHFATFPEELARRCILAGTSERGGCAECGAPWQRQTATERVPHWKGGHKGYAAEGTANGGMKDGSSEPRTTAIVETTGWAASCACDAPAVPQLVLDPFAGSGTTLLVARHHARHAIGIDLSSEYLAIAARRLSQLSLLGAVRHGD